MEKRWIIHVKSKINIRDGSGVTRTDKDKGSDRETGEIHRRRIKRGVNRSHAPAGSGSEVWGVCLSGSCRKRAPPCPAGQVWGTLWGALRARLSGGQCTRDCPNLKSASLQGSGLGKAHARVHRHPPMRSFKGKLARKATRELRVQAQGEGWRATGCLDQGPPAAVACQGQVCERTQRC